MKNKKIWIGLIAVLIAVLLITLFSEKNRRIFGLSPVSTTIDPAFKEYIAGFSGGRLSTQSVIKIRMNATMADSSLFNKMLEQQLFEFKPDIKGSVRWLDSQTLGFVPDEPLPQNKTFKAKFFLNKIVQVPDEFRVFEWEFATLQQHMEVKLANFILYATEEGDLGWMEGTLIMADVFTKAEDLMKCLKVTLSGKELPLKITPGSNNTFTLHIDSIRRSNSDATLSLEWDGKPVGAAGKGKIRKTIPSLKQFIWLDYSLSPGDEPSLSLIFSDMLEPDQNLQGLIRLERTNTQLNTSIEGNRIMIYFSQNMSGVRTLTITNAILNREGKNLEQDYRVSIDFGFQKPAIRFLGKGVIVPGDKSLVPFEAVGLKAINVKVTRIFENNVLQFLQQNDLEGSYEMNRVGKLVFNKNLRLKDATPNPTDLSVWNAYTLDLSSIISPEPGCIYQVTLSMKRDFAFYPCGTDDSDEILTTWSDAGEDFQMNEWNYYRNYYYDDYYDDDYYDDYSWSERDNPCHHSYYSYNRGNVSRNVLASDLGLIAKTGKDNSCMVMVNSITSSAPMGSVNVEIYNYQQQLISRSVTTPEGMCLFNLPSSERPAFVVARFGKQKGYLRLRDGESLSLSTFDISGATIDRGIKGFIYGERGVWRPGDTLFLTFILEDRENRLPANLPVTLSLRNARNQMVHQITRAQGVNGFYAFALPTDPDAPTGNWRAEVRVGGALFTKFLKVETIKPNRLKIDLNLSESVILSGQTDHINLNARWLHGGIAGGLRAVVEVTATPLKTRFDKHPGYVFDDPARQISSESITLFDGRLNDKGEVSFPADIKLKDEPPGMINLFFRTRVFERGGDFSIDGRSVKYSPFDSYAGLRVPESKAWWGMLETQKKHDFALLNLAADGKPVEESALRVDIYKIGWSWWWHRSNRSLARYLQDEVNEPYQTFTVNVQKGRGKFQLMMEHGDWGRYFIRVTDPESNHSSGQFVYFDYPGYRRDGERNEMASMLSFQSDKDSYEIDEEITLTIPTSADGHALISIENGTRVLSAKWIKTEQGLTTHRFKASKAMTPNIFVHVTLLQPHEQTLNDLPLRLYGLIPVSITDPATFLEPVITAPDKVRPESIMKVSVTEKKNKPMTYTLAVVDEGLLDLTRFKTPDPHAYFYAREALGVKTWDLYDKVSGAYAAQIQRMLSIGGDGDLTPGQSRNRANRFKPMVRFIGPFELKEGTTNSHDIDIPEYIGSVRIMVVAGHLAAYGKAEKTVEVSKPLMVLGTLPRVAGPTEEILVPVSVFAADKTVKTASVRIAVNELFEVIDSPSQRVTFSGPGEKLVFFKLKVKERLGVAKVTITAQSASDKSTFSIEMDVRNPNPPQTIILETALQAGERWDPKVILPGMQGTNSVVVEISNIPPIDLQRRLSYLISYPYGCLEQVVSGAFPQIYLSKVIDMPAAQTKTTQSNVEYAIRRVISYQNSSGSFSYWPGHALHYDYITSYAGHFLLAAMEEGYSVPPSVINRWINFQRTQARNWKLEATYYNSSLVQAYRLYTLALAGREELGAMNRLKAMKNANLAARWQLAAAYQLAGYNKVAAEMIEFLSTNPPEYRENDYAFGSSLRDRALILNTLAIMKQQGPAMLLLREIAAELSSDAWINTQATAFSLMGVAAYIKQFNPSAELDLSYSFMSSSAQKINTIKNISLINLSVGESYGEVPFNITNHSKGVAYARLIMTGTPVAEQEVALSRNLGINIQYATPGGESLNPVRIKQGVDFVVNITITNPSVLGNYKNLAITQIFPSGWEIRNDRLFAEISGEQEDVRYTYQDVRDDRVNTFFDLASGKKFYLKISLNAAYAGRFYMPGVVAQAMYDNSVYASSKGQWVEVVQE